jgi:hypothetical protein
MLGPVTGAIATLAWMLAQPAAAAPESVASPPVDPVPAPGASPAPAQTPAPVDTPAPADAPTEAAPPAAAPAPAGVEGEAAPASIVVDPAPIDPVPLDPAHPSVAPPTEPVVVVTPSPVPTESGAFVLVPVGPPARVQPVPPDVTIRRWHRSAGTLVGIAGASLVGSFALQGLRQSALRRCGADTSCQHDSYAYEPSLGAYTVLLHSMTVGAAGGAGAMLGNAAATEDVQVHGRAAVRKPGVLALGVVLTAVGSIGYVGVGLSLYSRQLDDRFADPAAAQLRRFLLVDPLVVATAAGAGMIGYAVRRKRQGEALARIRVTAGADGLGIAGQF